MPLLTPAEFGDLLARTVGRKLSRQYVHKLLNGKLAAAVQGQGAGKRVDAAAALRLYRDSADPARALNASEPGPEPALSEPEPEDDDPAPRRGGGQITFQSARTRREVFTGLTAEMEYRERVGQLVRKADVELEATSRGRSLRDAMCSLVPRIAPHLVGCDERTIRSRLLEEITRCMDEWAQTVEREIEDDARDHDDTGRPGDAGGNPPGAARPS